jgi:hypothetical protein
VDAAGRAHLNPGVDLDLEQSGVAEQSGHATADPRIGAVAAERDVERLADAVERRQRGITEMEFSAHARPQTTALSCSKDRHPAECLT